MPSKTNRTKTLPPSKRLSKGELAVAIRKIERRIAELKSFDISKVMRVHDGRADARHEKVHASLSEIFGEGTAEYARYAVPSPSWPLSLSLPEGQSPDSVKYIQATYREHIADMPSRLESLLESLSERREVQEILNERPELQVEQPKSLAGEPHPPIGKRVFVVHGHDEEAKQTVARFLEKLNLEPIILSEQPNKGQTIIEKFEASAKRFVCSGSTDSR
jgi:hypothetical protein